MREDGQNACHEDIVGLSLPHFRNSIGQQGLHPRDADLQVTLVNWGDPETTANRPNSLDEVRLYSG